MDRYEDVGLKNSKGPGGRPSKNVLDQLAVHSRLKDEVDRRKLVWRCAFAEAGCETYWSGNRSEPRILKHAAESCPGISQELRQRVTLMQQEKALGFTLKEAGFLTTNGTPRPSESSTVAIDSGPSKATPSTAAASCKTLQPLSRAGLKGVSVKEISQKAGREQKKQRLDFLIARFVVITGVPISILDSKEWKDLWMEAVPTYKPPSATTMQDVLIPREAANVMAQSLEHFQNENDLTITFDD